MPFLPWTGRSNIASNASFRWSSEESGNLSSKKNELSVNINSWMFIMLLVYIKICNIHVSVINKCCLGWDNNDSYSADLFACWSPTYQFPVHHYDKIEKLSLLLWHSQDNINQHWDYELLINVYCSCSRVKTNTNTKGFYGAPLEGKPRPEWSAPMSLINNEVSKKD